MPQTQLSSKLGSSHSIFDLKEPKNTKSSHFNFSKKSFSTVDIGAIVPVDWFNVYPKDKVKLGLRYILDTHPLEVPPMNNYFVRTHWYFIKMSALWKGWNTFITKGRSGTIDLEIPSLSYSAAIASVQTSAGKYRNYSCPNSLMDYLGLKPTYYNNNPSKSSYLPYLEADSDSFTATGFSCVSKFSILPLFAYQKICRFNYMPTNLLQDNHVWFPEDLEDHWYIGYNGENLRDSYFVPESATMPEVGEEIANFVPSADAIGADNVVDCRQLRYAMFGDDYFTSAKPWLVRGEETEIDLMENSSLGKVFTQWLNDPNDLSALGLYSGSGMFDEHTYTTKGVFAKDNLDQPGSRTGFGRFAVDSDPTSFVGNFDISEDEEKFSVNYFPEDLTAVQHKGFNYYLVRSKGLGIDLSSVSLKAKLSANTLRNLLALSVWQERNTLCDGSYNRQIQMHWNAKPKAPEYAPMYLGGTTDVVQFGQVVQTSSTVSGSPLGSKAGQGYASGGSDVFTFTADDYGIIMGVMIISPEVIYSQGVGHEWTDLTFDQQFQPEFANLGYQAIQNQELFAQNNSDDDDLFGYQTRYAYLKQRDNTVSGLFDLTPAQDANFGPFVQARRFSSLPKLSAQFVAMSPENIDRSFLSFPNFPAFKLQFASEVNLIRALPYQSTPETFGF